MNKPQATLIKRRPAESAGASVALLFVLGHALGLDEPIVNALGVLAGTLPAVVSWIVDNGGVRGVLRRFIGS